MEHQVSTWNAEASGCSDGELVAGLRKLTAADFKLGAKLIVYIGEVEARGVWREHAYSSLFNFLAEELRMSEGQAYLRMQAAQLARKYPVIISMLATGAVHISALRQISRLLTDDNHVELLERVRGKSKREVEKIVAELDPKPDVPSRMRKLPHCAARAGAVSGSSGASPADSSAPAAQQPMAAPGPASDASAVPSAAASSAAADAQVAVPSASSAEFVLEAPREKRGSSTPLGPGRYNVQITADEAMHTKLEQLQDLLRHRVPNGDLAVIIELGLDLLLDKTMTQRFGSEARARKGKGKGTSKETSTTATTSEVTSASESTSPGDVGSTSTETGALQQVEVTKTPKRRSRYIRRGVSREVYERDEGQCSFVSAEGKRCAERGFWQPHHVHAFALGGESTVENLQVMCHTHNQLLADRDFGRAYMQSKRLRAPSRRGGKPGHG